MNADRTIWHERDIFGDATMLNRGFTLSTASWPVGALTTQPQFGTAVGWIDPRRWWRPWLTISLWRWQLRVGWATAARGEAWMNVGTCPHGCCLAGHGDADCPLHL